MPNVTDTSTTLSQLAPVDADLDAERLRSRHPDRSTVIIVPAVIAISVHADSARQMHVAGYLRQIATSIHVPVPFSEAFRRERKQYRVRLRYGRSFEPWVVGVE